MLRDLAGLGVEAHTITTQDATGLLHSVPRFARGLQEPVVVALEFVVGRYLLVPDPHFFAQVGRRRVWAFN